MSMSTPPIELTPRHVRAARALLAWSQQDLAKGAGVATSTVADFERGQRTPVANNANAIRTTLEEAGIRFLPTGAVIGPSLPTVPSNHRPGAPVRWITADHLSEWVNQAEAAYGLPELLARLIRGSHGAEIRLRFPSNGGVRHPGWDGRTSTSVASEYVPVGETGWEIGSQRNNIAQKANEDFRKRTEDPGPLDPCDATYVFVTPRHWPKKDEWAQAMQGQGPWKQVRAYDADDLVHWIEQTPGAGLWLAGRLGKFQQGVRRVEDVWEDWSLATQWPLSEELVLCDRDEDAIKVLRWLRAAPAILSLQATTTEEVIAFFHASLGMLPEEAASTYRARSLVATTAAGARELINAPAPLILLLSEPEPGLARNLVDHGHYVLQAYDERPISRGEVRKLERPSREGIATALINMGIAEARAGALARDSGRNLAILRRLIPTAPGGIPGWASEDPPRALLAALLCGGWDEGTEADKACLSGLADAPYEQVLAALTPYVGDMDKPLRKVGTTWRMASPQDAWFLLAPRLTSIDLSRFERAAHDVLGSADPRYEMAPNERWMAAIKGVERDYSGLMRHGIGEVLILLALWGERAHTVPDAPSRAAAIVRKLLVDADRQRWWSLSGEFRLLAEAAPKTFLDAVEHSLDQEDPPIRSLFGSDGDGPFDVEHLSDLLWALESLAWTPELMPRVSEVLARLDGLDNPPGKYTNRPGNSLRAIHVLWNPQTFASLDQRLAALDILRKREPEAAWKLMLRILPSGHDSLSPSPLPRWRDFSVDQAESVTYGLIGRGALAISERLLIDAGIEGTRWADLVERMADLAPDVIAGLQGLERAEPLITNPAERAELWRRLRRLLHHHRAYPEAEWSMPVDPLQHLEKIYVQFEPENAVERIAWLFGGHVELPFVSEGGWQAAQKDLEAARVSAARTLYQTEGAAAVMALARQSDSPGLIGQALYEGGLRGNELDALLTMAVRSENERERDLAHGLIVTAFRDLKEPWAQALLSRAQEERWGETAMLAILRALPGRRWTWDLAARAGAAIEASYWHNAPVFWMTEDQDQIEYAIRKLISIGRARHALALVGQASKSKIPSALLIELLRAAAEQPLSGEEGANEATLFQHYVAEIFRILDAQRDVDDDTVASLEWTYLSVLDRSRRPAKALLRALSKEPGLFVQILSTAFKQDNGEPESEPEDPEHSAKMARQAYKLLELWSLLPGSNEQGVIDVTELEGWIKQARALAAAQGRGDIADSRIGKMLSASPLGQDQHWPAEAVREVLDLFRSRAMLEGFWIGKRNRRGVTSRNPRDGGELERLESQKYRRWSSAIALDHPHTSKALDLLADSYDEEAKRQDESVERLDWGY